jgi:SMODS and SLOG-associating 2TM effector domain 3
MTTIPAKPAPANTSPRSCAHCHSSLAEDDTFCANCGRRVREPEAREVRTDEGCIPFRLRIGVIGHRDLREDDGLRKAVRDAIGLAIFKSGYPEDGLPRTPLRLTVVSALAEGADRLVAKEVLEPAGEKREGSRLVCVLPVPRGNLALYRDDFASEDSKREFEELRKRAWLQVWPRLKLVPKDATKKQRDAGYEWAGKEVVRNCDVLIAIWDGKPPHGTGRTAHLIHWARQCDEGRASPEPSPDIRKGLVQRAFSSVLPSSPAADEAFSEATGPLRIIISTNGDHKPFVDEGPLWDVAAAAIEESLKRDLKGLDDFNARQYFAPEEGRRSVELTISDLMPARYRQCPRLGSIVEHIAPCFNRADQAAVHAQRWFVRSSYAFFGCTALATIIAAAQTVVFPGLWWLTIGELLLIIGSVLIVALENSWKNNNKHWFVYRFFAERLRTTCYLLAVGYSPTIDFDVGGTATEPAKNDWVRRAFMAVLAEFDVIQQEPPEDLETLSSLIRDHWMGGQMDYFQRTSKRLMRTHHVVRWFLYGVLIATIVAALLHCLRIWPLHSGVTQTLVMCAIGLPAMAGALSNVRSTREFSRHSFRYARMEALLRRYASALDEPDLKDLRQLAVQVGDLLTAETRNWLVEVSGRGLESPG